MVELWCMRALIIKKGNDKKWMVVLETIIGSLMFQVFKTHVVTGWRDWRQGVEFVLGIT